VFKRSKEADIKSQLADHSNYLSELIKLLKHRPKLDEALEQATLRVSEDLTEENYAEQQRLRSEKVAFDRRIFELTQREADI
jgi:DNA primase